MACQVLLGLREPESGEVAGQQYDDLEGKILSLKQVLVFFLF